MNFLDANGLPKARHEMGAPEELFAGAKRGARMSTNSEKKLTKRERVGKPQGHGGTESSGAWNQPSGAWNQYWETLAAELGSGKVHEDSDWPHLRPKGRSCAKLREKIIDFYRIVSRFIGYYRTEQARIIAFSRILSIRAFLREMVEYAFRNGKPPGGKLARRDADGMVLYEKQGLQWGRGESRLSPLF